MYLFWNAQNLFVFLKCFYFERFCSAWCIFCVWPSSSAAATVSSFPLVQVLLTRFWPFCRTPPAGCWARSRSRVSAPGEPWTGGRVCTGTRDPRTALRLTTPFWCWIPAQRRTLDTLWCFSTWMWMWRRRDAPTWMGFTWVSERILQNLCWFWTKGSDINLCWDFQIPVKVTEKQLKSALISLEAAESFSHLNTFYTFDLEFTF